MIAVVDFGMGNLQSISSKLARMKHNAIVASKAQDIEAATKIILPGVGHFSTGMANIRRQGLLDTLRKKVLEDRIPILGICLGMQLLTYFSDEGSVEGLKWIDGRAVRFDFSKEDAHLRVPHMGWNKVFPRKESILFRGIPSGQRFYFAHSYYVSCQNTADVASVTEYGREFVSAIDSGNIYGVQFHPEKSHDFGLKVIDNFLRYA